MKRLRATKDGEPLAGVWVEVSVKHPDGRELVLKELTDENGYTRYIDIDGAFK